MAGNVAAILKGFDYQWLYGWYRALDLLGSSGRVESITIEDPTAGFFDDVTLRPRSGTGHSVEFVQVKFHAESSAAYSATSADWLKLLAKAWQTWQQLHNEHPNLELSLVTTWQWDWKDPVRVGDGRFAPDFVAGTPGDETAMATREQWKTQLGDLDEDEFVAFLRSLRLRPSYNDWSDLIELTRRFMFWYGLQTDDDAIRKGMDIVRTWVKEHRVRITRDDLEAAVSAAALNAAPAEPSVALYVHTVRKVPFEIGADYELDWRDAFEGSDRERGHLTRDPADWNERLLPELEAMASRIEAETTARLLRVRGMARLSAWFAVGFVFRKTAGWEIEVDQNGSLWRTDVAASGEQPTIAPTESLTGDQAVVAVAIGVTGDPTPQARKYLETAGDPAGRLVSVLWPRQGDGAIRSAGDLRSLGASVKTTIQGLEPRPRRALVFYWGPASGAVFIGHALNAAVHEIQLYEDDLGTYVPSVLLR